MSLLSYRNLDQGKDTFQLRPLDLTQVLDSEMDEVYINYLVKQTKVGLRGVVITFLLTFSACSTRSWIAKTLVLGIGDQ